MNPKGCAPITVASEADFYELLAEYNGLVSEKEVKKDSTNCWHEWVEYTGLNEVFFYCRKCDVKMENKP